MSAARGPWIREVNKQSSFFLRRAVLLHLQFKSASGDWMPRLAGQSSNYATCPRRPETWTIFSGPEQQLETEDNAKSIILLYARSHISLLPRNQIQPLLKTFHFHPRSLISTAMSKYQQIWCKCERLSKAEENTGSRLLGPQCHWSLSANIQEHHPCPSTGVRPEGLQPQLTADQLFV